MKKLSKVLGLSMLVMASLCTVTGSTYASPSGSSINLVINEIPITDGVMPIIVNGRTLAPIRVISETLGAKVDYFADTQKVTITKGTDKIEMTIGKPQVKVNGVTEILDVVPIVKNGTTMLPIRFIGEALDCEVDWNNNTQTVTVIGEGAGTNVEKTVDKWGRPIRTTNLPKNASLFPYIAEDMPNWVYESIRVNKATPQWEVDERYNTDKTPKQLWDSGTFDYDGWVKMVEADLMTRMNIDYRTLDREYFVNQMEQLHGSRASSEFTDTRDAANQHVDFYKQHKVITKGEVKVLPETFWQGAYEDYRVNAYVKFTVIQQPSKESGLMYDEFGAMTKPAFKKVRPVENVVYEGVVQLGTTGTGPRAHINYNTSDFVSQVHPKNNVLGGAKPANQPSVNLK